MKAPASTTDLEGVMFYMATHYNMGKAGYGYEWRNDVYPRLSFVDRHYRPTKGCPDGCDERTYCVDGTAVASLEAAIAALAVPPVLTDEERRILDMVPTEFEPLRSVEDDLAGVPCPGGAIEPDTPHSRVIQWLSALRDKGMIEYGRRPDRGDGLPLPDITPEHLRWCPTIRRRPQ